MRKILLIILSIFSLNASAQGWLSLSGTVAQNYLEDVHGNIELLGGYGYKDFSFNVGAGMIATSTEARFDALQIQTAYLFKIPYFPLRLRTGYLYLPHTNTSLDEHIWHIDAAYVHPHVEVTIGYLIRTYSSEETRYSEFNDFIYCIQAFVWKKGNPYNLDFAISNYNDLYIEKSINPHVRMRGSYSYPENLTYFIEGLYGGSGVGNIYFDHSQWRIKLGLVWNI